MESSQKSIIGQGTVNRAGQGRAEQTQALVERAQGLVQVQRVQTALALPVLWYNKRMKRQEQPWRSFKGAFILGIRESNVESP